MMQKLNLKITMTKIEEILGSEFVGCYSLMLSVKLEVTEAMKTYAEWYAKMIIETCLNETIHKEEHNTPTDYVPTDVLWNVFHNLPKHEIQ